MKVVKIPIIGPTTGMSSLMDDDNQLLTGEETWPILGDKVSVEQVQRIVHEMAGLNKYWACLPKTKWARYILGKGRIVVGSLLVTSGDGKAQYGYYFRPPYEFHSWLDLGNDPDGPILDVALPGVIEKGLNTSDDIGPYLINREPVVLAGIPPDWCQYIPVEYLDSGGTSHT